MENQSTFQVYNASAGSGKTFTLVKEYLKILLTSQDIYTFQKILAITFTNKAAGEMKERILQTLEGFAEGDKSDIYHIIIDETKLDSKTLEQRSKKILTAILQNYSAFGITTIDSFTHKIIKSFAYDLGLSLNFEVEMDGISLLKEAVDVLISKIGIDKELSKLLINFSIAKIDDDKSWDISKELDSFAEILLNEEHNLHFRKISEKSLEDFNSLRKKLNDESSIIEKQFEQIGNNALNLIRNNGLKTTDFAYKGECPNHFKKLLTFKKLKPSDLKFDGRIDKNFTEDKALYAKAVDTQTKESIDSIYNEIKELYFQSKTLFEETIEKYTLYQLVLQNIIPLAVLNNINTELTIIKEHNNIRLNSEFNQLISDKIKDQPTPFIYERIGEKYQYYFVDEMQDTSILQWQNLIPLISNSLAQLGTGLLLVGDGKQSIYRWRGGKASQFINLSSETTEQNPFFIKKTLKNLATNHRSYSEIIHFNNNFFQHISNFISNESYKKLFIEGNQQKENSNKGGSVTISFLKKEDEKEENKLKYAKKVFEKIYTLKEDYNLGDICVLVRTKREGIIIANYLSEQGISITSSETLLLSNSSKVNFIINLLQFTQQPNNKELLFEILYYIHQHLQIKESINSFVSEFIQQNTIDFFKKINTYGIVFSLEKYNELPFYEKLEYIIRSFKLTHQTDAYIQFFLDVALEQQQKITSVQDFIDYWELKKGKLSIIAPPNSDSVEIMTIHKSKGLEFPVVIFPCDVDIHKQYKNKVWVNNLNNNYNGFEELLINYSEKLKYIGEQGTSIYQRDKEELELDNFNLLYVSLTRAVEQLHIITGYETTTKGIEKTRFFSGLFIHYLKEQNLWNPEQLEYCFGSSENLDKKKSEIDNQLINNHCQFISTPWEIHNMKIVANSSVLWQTKQEEAVNYGNLIHEIFSKIYTIADVKPAIDYIESIGKISITEKKNIEQIVLKVVNHPKLKEYYQTNYEIYNEREILGIDRKIIIPDRLIINKEKATIIDYKTGIHEKKHVNQLNKYAESITSLGLGIEKKILIYMNTEIDIIEI